MFKCIILVCGIALLAACSQGTEQHFEDIIDVSDIEEVSVSILEKGSFRLDDRGAISHFNQLLEEERFQQATQSEVTEIFKLSHTPELKTINIYYEIGEGFDGFGMTLIEDGSMGFIKFKDGKGSSFYKLTQKSPEFFEEILSYSEDELENRKKEVQVLDLIEEKENRERTIEVELIEGKVPGGE
ncbi:hypothetical protein [Alkalihalobacillus sp. TS-13]|uniref:hypothetical protein n=1 Tax=Alkalihalobacillus sp. TS-13 TaxID=2842455 RepID=UPI001C8830C9|nr:hypothetical protein [Alkalihalobacillus sp. TS-13]